jgi:hypothetical protein
MTGGDNDKTLSFTYGTGGFHRIYIMTFLTAEDSLTLTEEKYKQLVQMFLSPIYIGTLKLIY